MRKNGILASVFFSASAAVLLFEASSVSALSLDANIAGIFTDTTFTTLVAGSTLDPSGDVAGADLRVGQGILVTIEIANPQAEAIGGIFATLTVAGDQLNQIDAIVASSILAGGTASVPTSLSNLNSGDVKANSPGQFGAPGDVWIQAVSYGSIPPGTTGTGPDIAAVQLFFEILDPTGVAQLDFILGLTDGDAIFDDAGVTLSDVTFSGAAIILTPEPGTALLLSLGLVGLATAGRRQD